MPDRLPTLCGVTLCPNFAVAGRSRCKAHGAELAKKYRESASNRGYDRRHRRWRLGVLIRHPVCEECHEQLSVVADHIKDLDTFAPGDPAAWDYSNGTGLCLSCHGRKSGRKGIKAMRKVIG